MLVESGAQRYMVILSLWTFAARYLSLMGAKKVGSVVLLQLDERKAEGRGAEPLL